MLGRLDERPRRTRQRRLRPLSQPRAAGSRGCWTGEAFTPRLARLDLGRHPVKTHGGGDTRCSQWLFTGPASGAASSPLRSASAAPGGRCRPRSRTCRRVDRQEGRRRRRVWAQAVSVGGPFLGTIRRGVRGVVSWQGVRPSRLPGREKVVSGPNTFTSEQGGPPVLW